MASLSPSLALDRTYSGLLVLLLLAVCGRAAFAGAAPAPVLHEAVLQVALDHGGPGHMLVVLRGAGDALYLDATDFSRLHLKLPATRPILHGGRRYFAPAALPGCRVMIDERLQRALISAPPGAFETTEFSAAAHRETPVTPASPGAFFNYQLYGQQVSGQTSGGVYGDLGLFAGAGVLTNTVAGRDSGSQGSLVRLDTTYTRDFPARLATLNIGDAISDGANWGYAVRYAGIRWSRNFALRPDLVTTPLLSASGSATVPSTVDVFVNNQLVTSKQVPPGPFVINQLPTVSGTGNVNVVVRDALGREQVLTQSFYSSASLLAPGLSQYSFNLGSIRSDYAIASDHYGPMLAEASYRRGLSNDLTLEGHGEVLAHGAHAAGVDAAVGVGDFGLLTFNLVQGGDASGSGWLRGIGFEHRGSRASFVLDDSWYDRHFAQVGQPSDPSFRLRERLLAQAGISVGRFGSLSLAYVRERYRGIASQQTLSLTQNVSLGHYGALNLTVTRQFGAQGATSAYLLYVLPFGGRSAATASAVGGSGPGAPANEAIASVAKSPPIGPGSGYRFSASSTGNYDADWQQQFTAADLEVEAARNAGVSGRNAYFTGSLTWLDGQVHATRSIDGSFAMVDLNGLKNVPIYVENQLTARTDSSGKAILYNLRPYESNRISVDPTDLPFDTQIGAASMIVAPPYRSGIVVRFPIERVRGATFRLLRGNGKAVPVGALVDFHGGSFPVVLHGLVYVTGYDHGLGGEAHWPGGACRFELPAPVGRQTLPDLGKIRCRAPPNRRGGAR